VSVVQANSQDLVVSVQRLTPSTIEFDVVGVDASIANALRRVMIAEVSHSQSISEVVLISDPNSSYRRGIRLEQHINHAR
jgi:hypothetical protein